MSYNHEMAFEKALELAKEYVRSGSGGSPEAVLENIYNKVLELAKRDGFL